MLDEPSRGGAAGKKGALHPRASSPVAAGREGASRVDETRLGERVDRLGKSPSVRGQEVGWWEVAPDCLAESINQPVGRDLLVELEVLAGPLGRGVEDPRFALSLIHI